MITLLLLVRATYIWEFCFVHIPFVVNRTFNATPAERLQQHPSFLQRTAPIARSLCEVRTWHVLHILVAAPFCCDRKAQAACAQSFTLWQQVAIEIMRHNHSRHTLVVTFNRSHASIIRDYMPRSFSAHASHYVQSCTSSYWQRLNAAITLLFLFAPHIYWCYSLRNPICG